eukprot:gene34729-26387_t
MLGTNDAQQKNWDAIEGKKRKKSKRAEAMKEKEKIEEDTVRAAKASTEGGFSLSAYGKKGK